MQKVTGDFPACGGVALDANGQCFVFYAHYPASFRLALQRNTWLLAFPSTYRSGVTCTLVFRPATLDLEAGTLTLVPLPTPEASVPKTQSSLKLNAEAPIDMNQYKQALGQMGYEHSISLGHEDSLTPRRSPTPPEATSSAVDLDMPRGPRGPHGPHDLTIPRPSNEDTTTQLFRHVWNHTASFFEQAWQYKEAATPPTEQVNVPFTL